MGSHMAHLEQLCELHASLGKSNNDYNNFGRYRSERQHARLLAKVHAPRHTTSTIASWRMLEPRHP